MDEINRINDLTFFLCSIMLCKKRSKEAKIMLIKNFLESHFGPLISDNVYKIVKEYQTDHEINDLEIIKQYCWTRLPESLIHLVPFICYLINLEEDLLIENLTSHSIKHDHCYYYCKS